MSNSNNIIAFPSAAQRPRRQAPAGHRSGVCNLTAHRAQQAKSLAKDTTKVDTEDKANRPLPLGEVWDALNALRARRADPQPLPQPQPGRRARARLALLPGIACRWRYVFSQGWQLALR